MPRNQFLALPFDSYAVSTEVSRGPRMSPPKNTQGVQKCRSIGDRAERTLNAPQLA